MVADSPEQKDLRRALHKHITVDGLKRLQEIAAKAEKRLRLSPALPDLWLMTPGEHRFIEVKLPRDAISDEQLAGLATLAVSLRLERPVSVEVFELFPSTKRPRRKERAEEIATFDRFYNKLATLTPPRFENK